EVARLHLVERYRFAMCRGSLDRGDSVRRLGQPLGVEPPEGTRVGQTRNRHVDRLALLEGALADRQLRGVGIALEHRSLAPHGFLAQPPCRRLGADKIRNPPFDSRKAGCAGRPEPSPRLVSEDLLVDSQFRPNSWRSSSSLASA